MPRYVFHSFHYDNDCTRTQQVRHMGFIEGNRSSTIMSGRASNAVALLRSASGSTTR